MVIAIAFCWRPILLFEECANRGRGIDRFWSWCRKTCNGRDTADLWTPSSALERSWLMDSLSNPSVYSSPSSRSPSFYPQAFLFPNMFLLLLLVFENETFNSWNCSAHHQLSLLVWIDLTVSVFVGTILIGHWLCALIRHRNDYSRSSDSLCQKFWSSLEACPRGAAGPPCNASRGILSFVGRCSCPGPIECSLLSALLDWGGRSHVRIQKYLSVTFDRQVCLGSWSCPAQHADQPNA